MTLQLAVIVSDFASEVHMGAGVETVVRTFPLSDEAEEYIRTHYGQQFRAVKLAIYEHVVPSLPSTP